MAEIKGSSHGITIICNDITIFKKIVIHFFFNKCLIAFSMNLKNVWKPCLPLNVFDKWLYSFILILCGYHFFDDDVYKQFLNKDIIYVYVFCKAF